MKAPAEAVWRVVHEPNAAAQYAIMVDGDTGPFYACQFINYAPGGAKANAELVAKAVNAHDDLVAMLRHVTDKLEMATRTYIDEGSRATLAHTVKGARRLLERVAP